jgi:tubulin polyglutamylase TTLL6/13
LSTAETSTSIPLENPFFIIKPECMSQGQGIFLTRNFEDINPHDHIVAQNYITNTLLIDGLKFDLRIYVLLYGINPLRIYVYDDGLVRFATTPYELPNQKNVRNMYMHLTNYAINKLSENYKQNDNADGFGNFHKRSLKQTYLQLQAMGKNV